MTIFQMAVFSCVRLMAPMSDDVLSMSCSWQSQGFFASEQSCLAHAPKIGTPIFSDVADNRKVEKVRCTPVFVSE